MTRQRHELLPAARSRPITQAPIGDGPVVYWMSRDQRVQDNWALLHAQRLALQGNKALAVVFCLTLSYPSANLRHYSFLLAGLQEVTAECAKLGIPFILLTGKSEPPDVLLPFLRECNAGLLVCDFDPLRLKRAWQHSVATEFPCRIDEVARLEGADTHDPLWNAAQKELVLRGKLHGYLRMYWAKKLLEWTDSPETALHVALQLNDRYQLDGRDPNGFTGAAWSIGGVHDRPWPERPVFGKIRYMNARGCARKFDVARYIRGIEAL